MRASHRQGIRLPRIGLWFSLVLPSFSLIQKYFGWGLVFVYGVVTAATVCTFPSLPRPLGERTARLLTVATLTGLALLFAIVYPIADARKPERGSDEDDAQNVAVHRILHGQHPYRANTYLGGTCHSLPGALLLAFPFVLLGSSAYQNLFWLVVFLLVLRREAGTWEAGLRWFWLMLVCSPVVIQQLVTGSGYIANSIYVLLGLWWLVRADQKVIPAILWGVTLSSRANFLFLLPPAFGWLKQRFGWKVALRLSALSFGTFALLTLPLYLYSPRHFTPMRVVQYLEWLEEYLPGATWIIPTLTAGFSLLLARRPMPTFSSLLYNCAFIHALPVILCFCISRDPFYLPYGVFFLTFTILAVAAASGSLSIGSSSTHSGSSHNMKGARSP